MPTLRHALIAVISSISLLVTATGCDTIRIAIVPPEPTATLQMPTAVPPTIEAQPASAPTAAQAVPVAVTQPSPVARAAPAATGAQPAQAISPQETVIQVYRDWRPSVVTVLSTVVSPDFRTKPESSGTAPASCWTIKATF